MYQFRPRGCDDGRFHNVMEGAKLTCNSGMLYYHLETQHSGGPSKLNLESITLHSVNDYTLEG